MTWKDSISASVATIRRNFGPVRGGTVDEIREIELRAGGTLPAAYVAFLREVGGDPGDFKRGSEFDVRFLRAAVAEDYAEVLAEDGAEALPPHAFVFYDHQGYQFYWFVNSADPDPAVFHYSTSTRHHAKIAESFSEWLALMVESAIRVRSQLGR
ncbi:MAG: SMI1/KNR4 family protein [Sandaracinus sp.]